ncbi:hypothetical protein, partial [Jeotgalibacillus marinus]
GLYSVAVAAPGFQRLVRSGLTLVLGQTLHADLSLSLGTDQQTITVTADEPILQAQTSNIQTSIAGSAVVALPLNSRNFIQLSTLAPGVELPP